MKNIKKVSIICIAFICVLFCGNIVNATNVDAETMEELKAQAKNIDLSNVTNDDLLKVYDEMSQKYSNDDIAQIIEDNKDVIKEQGISDQVIDAGKEILTSTDANVVKDVIQSSVDVGEIQNKIENGYTAQEIIKSTVKEMPTEQKVSLASKLVLANKYVKIAIAVVVGLFIFRTICLWGIYEKANKHGWATLIPIYRQVVMYKICDLSPWLMLLWFLPVIGWVALIAIAIMKRFELAKSFDRGFFFGCGLWLLPNLFEAILAFNPNIEYYGADDYYEDDESEESNKDDKENKVKSDSFSSYENEELKSAMEEYKEKKAFIDREEQEENNNK